MSFQRFNIHKWYAVEKTLVGIDNIKGRDLKRHKYYVGQKVYTADKTKLQLLRATHGDMLSAAQQKAIDTLLYIEDLGEPFGFGSIRHQHHMIPVSVEGHPCDPDNLIYLSPLNHFLVHLCLSILFEERSLHTCVKLMAGRRGLDGVRLMETALLEAENPNSLVKQIGEAIYLANQALKGNLHSKKYDNPSPRTAKRREKNNERAKAQREGTFEYAEIEGQWSDEETAAVIRGWHLFGKHDFSSIVSYFEELGDRTRNQVKCKIYKMERQNDPRLKDKTFMVTKEEKEEAAELVGKWKENELDNLVRGVNQYGRHFSKIQKLFPILANRDKNEVKKQFYKMEKEKDPRLDDDELKPRNYNDSVRRPAKQTWTDEATNAVITGVRLHGRQFAHIQRKYKVLSQRTAGQVKAHYRRLEENNDPRTLEG